MESDSLLIIIVVEMLLFTFTLYSCSFRVPSSLINFKCKSIGSVRVYVLCTLLLSTVIEILKQWISMAFHDLVFSWSILNCANHSFYLVFESTDLSE